MKFVSNANDGSTWADQPRCPDCNQPATNVGGHTDTLHADSCPLAAGIANTLNADLVHLHQRGHQQRERGITAAERGELAAHLGHPVHGRVTVEVTALGHGRTGRTFWDSEGQPLGGIVVEAVAA
jgi:hypothetical protein